MTSGQMPTPPNFPEGQNNPYQQATSQPTKKPWYKNMKIIIPIIIVVVLIAAFSGNSGDDKKDGTSSNSTSVGNGSTDNGAANDSGSSGTEGDIGATLNSGQADITVSNLRASSDVLGSYICVDVNLVNTDDENLNVNPITDLKLTDPNNVSSSPTFGGETSNIEVVDVGAGGNRQFTSCFNGDGTPGAYKVTYEKTFSFQSKPVIWNGNL